MSSLVAKVRYKSIFLLLDKSKEKKDICVYSIFTDNKRLQIKSPNNCVLWGYTLPGLQQFILFNLPQVAVVTEESAGKSVF